MAFALHRFQGAGQVLGQAIGQQFGPQIRASLADNTELHQRFLPYHRSSQGQAVFLKLLSLHEQRYASYVAELRGCGEGAGVAFEDLFLINLRGEYRGYAAVSKIADVGECSTCTLLTPEHAVLGHNEDGAQFYRDRSYLIHVEAQHSAPFVALCYPGFLPSNAFGANRHGLCYSINNVRPTELCPGLGRHFLARSLLQADSLEQAIACLKVEPRAAGFNFTLGSIPERKLLNVEVSPVDVHVHEITGRYFHANHYLHLELDQQREPSSLARQQRAQALLAQGVPGNRSEVLDVLRDQADAQLPIWRRGREPDPGVTLLSAIFDLDAASLKVFPGPLDAAADSPEPMLSVALGEHNFGELLTTEMSRMATGSDNSLASS